MWWDGQVAEEHMHASNGEYTAELHLDSIPNLSAKRNRYIEDVLEFGLAVRSHGSMVVDIVTDHVAKTSPIQPGDTLVAVGGMPVETPSEVKDALVTLGEMAKSMSAQVWWPIFALSC